MAGHELPRNLFQAAAFTPLEEINCSFAPLVAGLFSLVLPLGDCAGRAARCSQTKASAPRKH
jgi:hypothetical protein